jgi:hypothetical protein
VSDYDDEPEARFSEGDYVALQGGSGDYEYVDQDNSDGPTNGDQIVMGDVSRKDKLQVISIDWERCGFVYNLANGEGWRVWGVPEDELRRWF